MGGIAGSVSSITLQSACSATSAIRKKGPWLLLAGPRSQMDGLVRHARTTITHLESFAIVARAVQMPHS